MPFGEVRNPRAALEAAKEAQYHDLKANWSGGGSGWGSIHTNRGTIDLNDRRTRGYFA